jgi:ATP-binding cassette subfamily C protein LapB
MSGGIYGRYDGNHLLDTLVLFVKMQGRAYSAESLVAGLPSEEGRETPELFSLSENKYLFARAAAKAGFKTKISRMPMSDINDLMTPCILLLKGEKEKDRDGNPILDANGNQKESVKACILDNIHDDGEYADIILPEVGEAINKVKWEDLEKRYLGFTFFLKKEINYDREDTKLVDTKTEHWFWGTIRKLSSTYKDVLIASLLINLFVLATPMFTMNVYDRVIGSKLVGTLWTLAFGVFLVYVIDLVLRFIRSYLLEFAGKKVDIIISAVLFERVLDLKMSSFPKPVGTFANILKEFESIRGFLTSSTIALVIDVPFTFIFLIAMYFIGGGLVVVTMASMVVILVYTLIIKDRLYKASEASFAAVAMKNGTLIESLYSMETLKTSNALGFTQWKFEEATSDIAEKSVTTKMLSASITTVTGFLIQLNNVVIILFGVYMIFDKELSQGALIATVIMASRAIAPMGQVAALLSAYEHVKMAYNSIDNVMTLPVEHPADKKFVRRPKFTGEIEFKHVNFNYPTSEVASLTDVNFKINAGEKVAIIGKTGSGKSTIQKLMLALYDYDEGAILIDGIDVRQIDPAELRKNISYLGQDSAIFAGTVRENIMYGRQQAKDEEIAHAAAISQTQTFVDKHPKGFEMPVIERGENLSGGQRQTIALARTLLMDTNIIVLDEPLQSLDSTTESRVIRGLKEELQDKTAIIITHKPEALALVDRIIVVDDGRIMIDGSKEDVMKKLQRRK